ncbi:MAG: DUF4340 domain-containing protein [Kofleriaceae bacterium]
MTRAARSTLAWTATVAVLAALVVLTRPAPVVVARPALVPGLVPHQVTALTARRGDREVVVAAVPGGWRVVAPTAGAADAGAVLDLLSTVASARADRRARHPIAAPRATVTVTAGATTAVLVVGEDVPATGQVWIGTGGDRAALVPGWVGRALLGDPERLRARALVPPGVAPVGLELHADGVDLVLAGASLVRRDGGGVTVRLAPAVLAELLTAVADLRFTSWPAPPPSLETPGGALRLITGGGDVELAWAGSCVSPATRWVVAETGTGCVDQAALARVISAGRAATGIAAIAPTPWTSTARLARLTAGATALVRDGGGWRLTVGATTVDADAETVAALEAALAAPATPRARTPADVVGAARWDLVDADGAAETWSVGTDRLVRGDEPVALALGPAAQAAVATVGVGLRGRQLARLDPDRVDAVVATGAAPATVTRGAVVGEWLAASGTATDAVAALVRAVAAGRADAVVPHARLGRVRRALTLTTAGEPPLTVQVGAADATGCYLATDPLSAYHVSAALCAALLAPLHR